MIKKITSIYRYIYFRLLLFHRKQWAGNKSLGSINSNYAMSFSGVALIYLIILVYERVTETDSEYIGSEIVILIGVAVFLLQSYILSGDDDKLEEKYLPQKESDPFWQIKGFLSLLFVFGPIILLIILA